MVMWGDVMMVLVDVMMVMWCDVVIMVMWCDDGAGHSGGDDGDVMMVLVDVMMVMWCDVMMVLVDVMMVMWRDDGQSDDDDDDDDCHALILSPDQFLPMINMHINRSIST